MIELTLEPDGALHRVARALRDAATLPEHVDVALEREPPGLVEEVVTRGHSRLIGAVDDEVLGALLADDALYERLRATRPRSLIVAPLRVGHGDPLGVLVLIGGAGERDYDTANLELASELAWRIAMSIQNARLHRQARVAVQARDRVLGLVAHDLRTPLGTIAVCSQLLEHELSELGGDIAQTLELTRRSVHRMDRLIQDLLDVAALEAGRLALERSAIAPARLIEDAVTALRPRATALGIALEVVELSATPCVLADADRIVRVLCNLLDNALKFTPSGGRIMLTADAGDGEVAFHVIDTGPGIEPTLHGQLFEPFWQANTGDARGVGLGLPICKEIIEVHGGRIGVTSVPGDGSTFWFTLPVQHVVRGS